MATNISPNDYCKDPQKYKDTPGLDDQTLLYWSQYCRLKKQINNQGMPSQNDIRKALPKALEGFILGLVSPKGLEMMGMMIGAKIAYRSVKTAVGNLIKNGLDKETLEAAEKFIADGGDEAIANGGGIMDRLFADMAFVDVKVAEEAGYSAGRYAASAIFDAMDFVLDFADEAMIVLMVLSMIFDAWDPCKLNVMLDNKQLALFTTSFNDHFRQSMLADLDAITDGYGHTILNGEWPLQYYAERSALVPFKNTYYNKIRVNLVFSYMNSLRFNSCGMPMNYQRAGSGKLVSNDILSGLEKGAFVFFADDNTVVVNWLVKWWPVLLTVIIILIVLFLVIKNRQNGK